MSSRLYRRLVPAWSALAAVAALCAAAARADIHVEPYLQDPQTDAMSVLWWTDDSQPDSRVTFGRGSLNQWVPGSNEYVPSMDKYVHEARLTGLLPETRYDYRAVSGPLASEVYGFTTAVRRSSDFAVSILGDGRTDNDQVIADHRAVLSRAALLGPDLVFEIGDMVHFGTATHWDALYRRIVTATDASDPGIDQGSRVP